MENKDIGVDEFNEATDLEQVIFAETIKNIFFPPVKTLEDSILENDTTISASDLDNIKSILPKLKNIQKLTYGQIDYLREIVDAIKKNKTPEWKKDILSNMETRMGLTVPIEELSNEQLIMLGKLTHIPGDAFLSFKQSEEGEEKEVEIKPKRKLVDPMRLLSTEQQTSFEEEKEFTNMKHPNEFGKIRISNSGKNILTKWLKTSTRKDVSKASITSLNKELSAPDKQFDITKLNKESRQILRIFNNFKVIIGSAGRTLEGVGMRGRGYGMAYCGSNFGYTKPHYSLAQQIKVC